MIEVSTSKPNPELLLSRKEMKHDNKKQKLFLRSYSELLSRHFTQSIKEKLQLRKNMQQKDKPRPKTIHQKRQLNSNRQAIDQPFLQKAKSKSILETSLNINRKSSQQKLNPSQILTKSQSTKQRYQPNPENNQSISQILISKTHQIQKNSYQNVLLNKKLHQTIVQKNDLFSIIQTLKMEILKEKKNKSKISTKMAKLMNKIEQTNTLRKKVQNQRNVISDQTQTSKRDILYTTQKNHQLHTISLTNQQRITTQKQLIQELQKNIEAQKVSYYETRVHLNQLKSIFMQQSKYLTNTQSNFDQAIAERQKMFYIVESSVNNAKVSGGH